LPRITNESLAEHREEVLSGARKFIYPLTHSKHKVLIISSTLITLAITIFMTFCLLSLYRWQNSSEFMYRITKVLPFPIARAGGSFVSYESYLFELRHYIHYYETQENVDFSTETGKLQLADYRKRSLERVVNDTYVRRLAREHKIEVSDKEIDQQVELLRNQNRLGGSNEVFEDVLQDFWGWSVADFRRSLHQQLLAQKLLPVLDAETKTRQDMLQTQLQSGADFAALAAQVSDDAATKDKGGDLGFSFTRDSQDVDTAVVAAAFNLSVGEVSTAINVGYGVEFVKVLEKNNDSVRVAHILLRYKEIESFINDLKAKQNPRVYIKT
jgi:hypothetical protein